MKDKINCDEGNRTIVRIWSSKFSGGENVGHVSIKTTFPKSYMSLWPSLEGKSQGEGIFKPIPHEFHEDLDSDLRDEDDREPEIIICLYDLNCESIVEKFNEIKRGIEERLAQGQQAGWVLIGGNRLINQNSGESCASLAWKLLKAGGIYDEISSSFSSKFSSIVTPDGLSKAVKSAKQYELKEHPETRNFVFEGETHVVVNKTSCIIM